MALRKFSQPIANSGFRAGSVAAASLGERLYWYYEGNDCRGYMGNWNYSSEQYNMTTLGEFGNSWVHGWGGSGRTYLLTVNNLPAHSKLRYTCNIHMVDSWDNEYNNVRVNDNNGNEFQIAEWRKNYGNAYVDSLSTSNGGSVTQNFNRTYSYVPWGGQRSGNGYITVTSNWYNHSRSQFQAWHRTDLDQGQGDEAYYISHVQIDLQ